MMWTWKAGAKSLIARSRYIQLHQHRGVSTTTLSRDSFLDADVSVSGLDSDGTALLHKRRIATAWRAEWSLAGL